MTKEQLLQRIASLEAQGVQDRATIAGLEIQARVLDVHITRLLQQVAPVLVSRADVEAQIAFEREYGPTPHEPIREYHENSHELATRDGE